MKLSAIAAAMTAAALTLSSAAVFAQPMQPGRNDRQPQTARHPGHNRPQQAARPQPGPVARPVARPQQQPPHQRPQTGRPQFQTPAPAVQHYQFHRGHRLAPQYRSHIYVVNDWGRHRLPPPPRGQHWVQVNGSDYILVAIATGVIMQVLLANSF